MTSGCTVCVCGFPTELPPERVVDKLTVHFLRARNGGGEIANVEFAPGSPDCAMVTFEEGAVAQRVLKTNKQVLTVGGKSYPLRVSPCTPGLNPNEIFVHVHVEIDYGRVLGGKETLQSLCKQYGGLVFKFHPRETTCLATGAFTEMQAFSSELLRDFQSKPRDCTPGRRRSADQAGGDGRSLQGALKTQDEKKSQKATSEGPPPRSPKENHAEPLEDFSVVMDSDVYLYMQKFCQQELSSILLQHQVGVVDVNSDGLATLYLQAAARGARGASARASAHLAISRLSQQLEATLRKEQISQRDLGGADGARGLLGELQRLCPRLLCQQDEEHLSLVGDRADVSQAKQHVQGCIDAREDAQGRQKLGVPQAVGMAQIRGKSPTPVQRVPSAGFLPRKGSLPGGSSGKMGSQLATGFPASDSGASLPPFSSLPGDFFQAADSRTAETRNRTPQAALAPEPGSPVKPSSETKADSPATRAGGPLPSSEAWRSPGTRRLLPFCAPSSAFGSLGLVGAVGTAGPKVSALGRPNSSLLPKTQSSRASVEEPLAVARITADHLRQSSREESLLRILQQDVCQEADLQVPKPLAVRREGGSQEGPSPAQGAGGLTKPSEPICECFSYSQLSVEGPEDEALADLCSTLKACHDGVAVSQERHHLGLCYPWEAKPQVLEALRGFSAQRLAFYSEQLFSHLMPSKETSKSEIQRSLQQVGKGSTAGLRERPPPHLGGLAGEDLSSWVQRFPDASQPAAEQHFPSDGKAVKWRKPRLQARRRAARATDP